MNPVFVLRMAWTRTRSYLAKAAVPFGIVEPVLHRDAAFYLAVLPLLGIAMVVGETIGRVVTDQRLQARHAYARRLRAQQVATDLQS